MITNHIKKSLGNIFCLNLVLKQVGLAIIYDCASLKPLNKLLIGLSAERSNPEVYQALTY